MITDSTDAPTYDSSKAFMNHGTGTVGTSGNGEETYRTEVLEGGKVYYLHLGYKCEKENTSDSTTVKIKDI